MSDKAICVVYEPPRPGMPHLAVTIFPDGEINASGHYSEEAADQQVAENQNLIAKQSAAHRAVKADPPK